jgi:hypothetical protein
MTASSIEYFPVRAIPGRTKILDGNDLLRKARRALFCDEPTAHSGGEGPFKEDISGVPRQR